MKTIDLRQQQLGIKDLLQLARLESLLILSEDGNHFILEEADDLEKEVVMLGKSEKFMQFLQNRSKEKASITIDQFEKKLKTL